MSKITNEFTRRKQYDHRGFTIYREGDVQELLSRTRDLEDLLKVIKEDPHMTLRVQYLWKINDLLE